MGRNAAGPRRIAPSRLVAERHRIERAIERYLRDCYRTQSVARVSELADFLGANRPHLSSTVRVVLGRTLLEALRERQLAYARRLLEETQFPIAEVALMAAFGTERTLYRNFRQRIGMTPSRYRAENRRNVSRR